ncbi:MAG: hypothetical protein HQK97_09865, partial [Nitrospirae bacterium]|nr:hypothetical protein [Nitrospirota bacterium]
SIDDTGVFEEGQTASADDTGDFQNISDSDLTTRELKDVLESLTGETDEKESVAPEKDSTVMDDSDIEALLAGTMSEETSDVDNSEAQKTVVIAEELPIETITAEAQAHSDPDWNEQTQDFATSFANEDILLGMSAPPADLQKEITHEPKKEKTPQPVLAANSGPELVTPPQALEPVRPQAAAAPPVFVQPHPEVHPESQTYHASHTTSGTGGILLTTADVTSILQKSLEQKVTQVIDDGAILSIFKESVEGYINESFKDAAIGLDDMVSESINKKISDVVGTINLEVIVNQVISSTIKGILATLPSEIFKMTREITERVITGVLQDNIPAIKRDVEKVIWEAVPGVAERLINHEIEQIKSEFM